MTEVTDNNDPFLSESEKELLEHIGPGDSLVVEHYGPDGKLKAQRIGDGSLKTSTDYEESGVRRERIKLIGPEETESDRNLSIAHQLLNEFNKVHGTDFAGPYIPKDPMTGKRLENTPTDVEVESQSDPRKRLRVQITSSEYDPKYRRNLKADKEAAREGTPEDTRIRIKKALESKASRYGEKDCKTLVLVIDAWPTLTERDVQEFIIQEQQFLNSAPFQDLWVLSLEVGFTFRLKSEFSDEEKRRS